MLLDRIRRRLTMGYVGILAFILVLLGVIVAATFSRQITHQQDELLEQRTRSLARGYGLSKEDYRKDYRIILESPDYAAASYMSDGQKVPETDTASYLGLPSERLARATLEGRKTVGGVVESPKGDKWAVASTPVVQGGVTVGVFQVARSPQVVGRIVGRLVLILASVGLGGLALAAFGGLYMSRRAMRPAETSFERQRSFIADASHELKTPLTLIRADAEVLSRGLTDPDERELADDLLSETDRMSALLSDLLTLARLDAGKLGVEQETFDLAGVIAETSERFAVRAETEGKRLEARFDPDGGKLPASGDAARTGQILAALVDNALRFTPEGGLVTVGGRAEDGRAETTVTDTGPGVPPEHLGRIFDRFYRAEEARTRAPSGGGTGLGLSIARDLARAQGGELIAANAEGGGASFKLRLPAGS